MEVSRAQADEADCSIELKQREKQVIKVRDDAQRLKSHIRNEKRIQAQLVVKKDENASSTSSLKDSSNYASQNKFIEVSEYVAQKAIMYKLRDEIKSFERKVDILEKREEELRFDINCLC